MFFEIIIVVCIAVATAGVTLLAFRLFGARAPKTLVFTLAGLAMILFTAWNRHTWAERTMAGLPDSIRVVQEIPYSGWLEPWTFALPRTGALIAIDTSQNLSHPAHPGIFVVTLLNIEPYVETLSLRQIIDCAGRRRTLLRVPTDLSGDSLPADLEWIGGGQPPQLFAIVCKAGS